MKLIEFSEQTEVIAKNQPPYLPFPCHRVQEPEGRVIACWKLSFAERIKLLFTGKLWHTVLTFNQPLQPQLLQSETPFVQPNRLMEYWKRFSFISNQTPAQQ